MIPWQWGFPVTPRTPWKRRFPVIAWIVGMSSVSVVSVRWVLNVFWWVVCIVVMVRPIPWIHVISVRGISIEGVTDMRVIVGITMAIISYVITIGIVTLGIPVAIVCGVSWVVRVLGQMLVTAVGGRLVIAASVPWRAIPDNRNRSLAHSISLCRIVCTLSSWSCFLYNLFTHNVV